MNSVVLINLQCLRNALCLDRLDAITEEQTQLNIFSGTRLKLEKDFGWLLSVKHLVIAQISLCVRTISTSNRMRIEYTYQLNRILYHTDTHSLTLMLSIFSHVGTSACCSQFVSAQNICKQIKFNFQIDFKNTKIHFSDL